MRISELSEATGMSVPTIKYYLREASPSPELPPGGTRPTTARAMRTGSGSSVSCRRPGGPRPHRRPGPGPCTSCSASPTTRSALTPTADLCRTTWREPAWRWTASWPTWAGRSTARAGQPARLRGSAGAVPGGMPLSRSRQQGDSVRGAGDRRHAWGHRARPNDEVVWWQADDFWWYAMAASVAVIRSCAERRREPVPTSVARLGKG